MSLFEKIQNRRYDLQEAIDDKGNITPEPGDIAKEKSIVRNIKKKQKKFNLTNVTSSGRVKATSDILKSGSGEASKSQKDFASKFSPKNLSKTLSQTTSDPNKSTMISGKSDETVIRTTKATGDEGQFRRNANRTKITGDVIPKKDLPKTKVVNQADVSKQAQEFTKKVNKERIIKQGNIFGGEDEVKPKRRVGSTKSRGTRTKTKTTTIPGQQKLNLGGDVTKKTPKPRLSKSGEVVTDLRTTGRKPRNIRKRPSNTKPPKPEKMVIAKDPIKGGFKKVGATTTAGREVIKKSVSTDELLKGQSSYDKRYKKEYKKAFNNKGKSGKTLFQRIKDIGRTSKKYLGKAHQFMIKDAGFRKTSEFAGYGRNITKNTFKNTMRGNTLRTINKYLPGKYKALAAIVAGTYLATRGKKGSGGGASGGGKKFYKAVEIPMGFDSKSASKKKIYDPKNK